MKEKRIPRVPNANGGKIYLRNSGRDEKKKLAPEVQLERSATVLANLGATYDPTRDVYDEGEGYHSAFKRENLDEFDKLIDDAISDPHCKYIASFDSSRIFRNSEIGEHTIKRLEYHGIEWHAWLNGHLSLKQEEHRLKTKVTLMLDEEISRRTTSFLLEHYQGLRDDMARRGQIPHAGSRPMFGLVRKGSAKNNTVTWEPQPDQWRILLDVFRLYATGKHSPETIARMLYQRGVRWKNPAMQDSPPTGVTIRKLIHRFEFYAQFLDDPDLVRRVYEVRAARSKRQSNHRAFVYPPILLRGLVYCADCGRKYVQSYWLKRNREPRPFYMHPRSSACAPKKKFSAAWMIESRVLEELRPVFTLTPDEINYVVEKILAAKPEEPEGDIPAQIAQVTAHIEKLNRDFAKTSMRVEEYNALRAEFDAQLKALREREPQASSPAYTKTYLQSILTDARAFFEQTRSFAPDDASILMTQLIARVQVRNGEITEIIRRVPV